MKSAARNISVLNEYEDEIWLTYNCECGCGEQLTLEILTPKDINMISMDIYAEVYGYNREIKLNAFKQFFSDLYWKVTTILKVLFKGQISLQTGVCINSKQGVEDLIKALTEASGVFKDQNLVDIDVDLPEKTIKWLEERAEEKDIDFNTYIVGILWEYLDDEEKNS